MASSIPLQIAETVQTAHIRHNPSAIRDLAPSTAADTKVVLEVADVEDVDEDEVEDDDDEEDDDDDDTTAWDTTPPQTSRLARWTVAAAPKGRPLPPLPDLRFEQSYLHSLAAADTWWKVALVTLRDQVVMPLVQGLLYNLAVCGWQYWNRTATLSGQSAGARVRRWWYGVNNWPVPRR